MYGKEFSKKLARKINKSNKETNAIMKEFLNLIEEEIKEAKTITFMDFGKFELVKSKSRMGINPKTGKSVKVKAKNRLKFKSSVRLIERVNLKKK